MKLKPYKREFEHSYACGVFPACELAKTRPDALKAVVITEKALKNEGVMKLRGICDERKIPFEIDDATVAKIYPKDNVYAVGVFDKYSCELDFSRNHVVLVNPSDMGNMGTIIRTMCAFEIFDLAIIRPCCDVFDPKVVRASMGAVFKLNIRIYDTFEEYTRDVTETRQLIPFMLNGAPMESVRRQGEIFSLIMGNEAAGLPDNFINIGTPARIMHASTVDSLNLPIATGIGIYYFSGLFGGK